MNLQRILGIGATCLAATVLSAVPASAKGGGHDDVRVSGHCSAGSTWKMKAKPDDGRIEVELQVDSNRVGQVWSVRTLDNNVLIFSGTRRTTAPSGSFDVELRSANRAGADRFTATARNARTGELCRAHVTL